MVNPYLIGGAAVGLGLLGYGLVRRVSLKKKKAAADADARSVALKKAYATGCADGEADVAGDSGKVHNPRPALNHSDVPELQKQYNNGYNDCYEKHWVAPPSTPDVVKDATPSAGGAKGRTPYKYGCDRGTSTGYADAEGGYARDSWKVNLATSGSLKRQAESGNPAQYRAGYEKCYLAAFDGAKFGKSAGEVISVPSAEDGGGFSDSVLGLTPTAVGRLGRGLGFWDRGKKVQAVSGTRERYSSTVAAEQAIQTGGT